MDSKIKRAPGLGDLSSFLTASAQLSAIGYQRSYLLSASFGGPAVKGKKRR
jgi:hypothetical protein